MAETNSTAQLSSKTKEQLLEHIRIVSKDYEEKQKRVLHNYEEELQNRNIINENKIGALQRQIKYALPNMEHMPRELFYYKFGQLSHECFALAKKITLKFDKYQLGRQIYNLPSEYRIDEFHATILAIFDTKHKFITYGLLNCRLEPINTFHTKPYDICVGENYESKKMVDFKKPETILKGFEEVKKTLETINPDSLLTSGITSVPRKLQGTMEFVKSKNNAWHEANDVHERDDEDACMDCGERMYDCRCEHCSDCGMRLRSNHYDQCVCERCDDCGLLVDDCECNQNTR